ncbi:MAG: pilus assembly protein PilW [Gammaproteobacteria bacterium]|nr:MAG: pilus assembly protein PilW [Gammaproteobacteria bacterium]
MQQRTAIITLLSSIFLLGGCITTTDGKKPLKAKPKAAAKSYFELGASYMQRGRYDLAEPKLQRSIDAYPTAEAYNALALLYEEIHDNLLAEETYEKLLATFPDYGRGYLNYNIFLCKYNRTGQIEALAAKMAAQNKEIAAIGQIAAGNCAFSKGDMTTAANHYKRALIYEQYAAGALLPLAEIDLQKGFVNEAKEKVDKVNNYIGYSARSLYLSILINRELGNRLEERRLMQSLRARFPNSPEARNIFSQ